MIEKIEILQHGEGRNLGSHPREEASRLLCIVAYHHELVIELRKDRLFSLSETFVGSSGWCPVLPVQSVRDIKGDVGCLKQVQLDRSTQIALVAQNRTVAVLPLYIFEILQIMYIGSSHIKRMYNSCDTTQSVELISVIVHILRCTVAPRGCMLYIIFPHLAFISFDTFAYPYPGRST